MSIKGLNDIVGTACISDNFRMGLLNGQRAELIGRPNFELEPEEKLALLAIQADDLANFSVAVEHLVALVESRPVRSDSAFMSPVRWPTTANRGAYLRQQP